MKAQVARFLRLFLITLLPQLVALNGHYGRSAIIALVVGAAEVTYRQLVPAQ